jgi:hypothetical protein
MKKILLSALLFSSFHLFAQIDDLQRMADSLDALNTPVKDYTNATFKATQIIGFPTTETMGKGAVDILISHRFGDIASGNGNPAYNAFGLDGGACIRLALDHGITDWLQVGIGRTSADKLADASVKIKLLRQTTDNKTPLSMTLQSKINYTFLHDPNAAFTGVDKWHYPVDRISYTNTLVVARKFSENLSLELNEFFIHYNIVDHAIDKNNIFATGISGRYKVSKRFAITFEYAYRVNKYIADKTIYHDPFGIGFDLETGGHVFQVSFSNEYGMNEAQFIPYNTSDWLKGNIRVGFNIARVFAKSPKKK